MLKKTVAKLFYFVAIAIFISSYTQLFSQDFWYPLPGPYGGNILSIAETSSGTLFVGTEGGGVFRSFDNGDSWEPANNGIPSGAGTTAFKVYSIFTHTNGDIFIGTSKEARIYRSNDGGDNWTQVYNSSNSTVITTCFTSTANGSILAGTEVSILKSTDNGDTWNTTLSSQTIRQMLMVNNGNIIASTSTGIFKSVDDGNTWNVSNNGLTNTNVVALNKNTLGVLFCSTINNKVFKSTDNGDSWIELSIIPASAIYCISSNSSNELYAGTFSGLYKSTDDGNTWTEDSLDNQLIRTLHFDNFDQLFVGTDNFGIYRYLLTNPFYEQINNGLKNTFINTMTFNLNGDLFCATNSNKFYKTSNLGTTWIDLSDEVSVGMSPRKIVSLLTLPNGVMIAGTRLSGIFRSTNDGDNWVQILNGFTTYDIYSLALDKQSNILAGSTGKLYKSTNQGLSWTSIDNNQINHTIYDMAVNSLGHIFAATYGGGVFRSTDAGGSWTQINNGLLYNYAYAIAINDSDDIFVTGEMAGIYKSTNNGDSWTSVLTGTFQAYDMIINDLGDIFVSSIDAQGVLRSINNGNTWEQINSGLYNYNMQCLTFSGGPFSYLFGGGKGTGVWLSQLPTGPNLGGGHTNLGLPIIYGIPTQEIIVIGGNSGPNQKPFADYPIEKVFVTLQEINHPDISELLVTLEHNGIIDTLVYQPGINGANFLGTKFKDEALLELSQGTAPFTSSFKPQSALSVFNGSEATGNWTLTITDMVPGNDGTLESWYISILSSPTTDIQDIDIHPSDFMLSQNYPNPFNPTTKIRFQNSNFGFVSLKVYDLLGGEVATLISEEKSPGNYEVEFTGHSDEGQNLPSGVYFYQLRVGGPETSSGQGFIETKKMILMK